MIGWIEETEKFELKIGVFDQNESERNLPGEFALSKIILPLSLYFHINIYKDSNIIDDISQHEIDTAIHLQWK